MQRSTTTCGMRGGGDTARMHSVRSSDTFSSLIYACVFLFFMLMHFLAAFSADYVWCAQFRRCGACLGSPKIAQCLRACNQMRSF